jgi:hypothetical protein
MIDFADVKAAIKARFEANWPHTAVAYENGAFTPPDDGFGNQPPFVRLYVVERASQAPPSWNIPDVSPPRLDGAIYAVGYVPENTSDDALEQYMTLVKGVFEGASFASTTATIYVQASSAGPAGTESPWFKKMLIFPFYAVNNPA